MNITTVVNRGIIFLKFDGVFDNNTFNKFSEEIDYLLYKQGVSYYTFDFTDIEKLDEGLLSMLQNKLIEIFLNCGKVAFYGLKKPIEEKIGTKRNDLFYVTEPKEIYNLLSL